MGNEEYIKILQSLQDWLYLCSMNGGASLQREAIDKAIEALSQPERIRCNDCKHNYGLAHGGEFNPDDIVCTFFDTDGMRYCDFCSYAERREVTE